MTQSRDLAISVVIPSFNCANFLGEAINSALEQSLAPAEVLVIDDGSTDKTAEVAAAFGNRIRFVSLPHSGRPSVPRNVGLKLATSDFISIHDADDVMLPGKLERAVEVFQSNSDVALLFTDFQAVDERGSVIKRSFLSEYQTFRVCLNQTSQTDLFLANGKAVFQQLLYSNFIGTSSVVVRRDVIINLGGFDESLTNSDDIELWYRLTRAGYMIAFLDHAFHNYRVRFGSISSRGSARYPPIIRVLRDQMPFIEDPIDTQSVERRISEFTLGYAYHLRIEGDYRQMMAVCYRELMHRPSWQALRDLVLAGLFDLLSLNKKER